MTETTNLSPIINNLKVKIADGHTLCVLGWKTTNHNDFSRSLAEAKRVVFVDLSGDNDLGSLPQNAIVIMTRFVAHKHTNKLKSNDVPLHPHPLTIGDIRKILLELAPVLMGEPEPPKVDIRRPVTQAKEPPTLAELEQQITSGGREPDQYDRLATAFTQKAAQHPEKLVGSRKLSELLTELNIDEKAPELVKKGLVVAVVQTGQKRIGWYKAGPELQSRLQQDVSAEPSDPLDKAAWLLEREPEFRQKLAELKVQMVYWEARLERVEAAKELLRQIGEL